MKLWILAATLLCLGSSARAQTLSVPLSAGLSGTYSGPVANLDFIGCVPFRVEASTAPKLVQAGAGILYYLSTSSGTAATDYSVAFDSSASINNSGTYTLAIGVSASSVFPLGYAITPKVYTSGLNVTQGSAGTPNSGVFTAPKPIYYATGLVVANADVGQLTVGCYRPAVCTNATCNPY